MIRIYISNNFYIYDELLCISFRYHKIVYNRNLVNIREKQYRIFGFIKRKNYKIFLIFCKSIILYFLLENFI